MHGSEGGRKSTLRSPLPRLIFPAITSVHEAVRETAQRKEHVHGPNYPYVARSVRGLESRPAQAALPRAVRGRIAILELTVSVSSHRLAPAGRSRGRPERTGAPPCVGDPRRSRSAPARAQGVSRTPRFRLQQN